MQPGGFPNQLKLKGHPLGSFEGRALGWDHGSIGTAEIYSKAEGKQEPGRWGSQRSKPGPSVELERATRAGTGQAGRIIEPGGGYSSESLAVWSGQLRAALC